MTTSQLHALCLSALLIGAVGCAPEEEGLAPEPSAQPDPVPDPDPEPRPDTFGFARVVHLIIDVPLIDMYLNDEVQPVLDGTEEGFVTGANSDASMGYLPFLPFDYDVHVVAAGGTPGVDDLVTLEDETVEAGLYYTIVAFGSAGAVPGAPPTGWVLDDDRSTAPGEARATLLHTAPGIPDADVLVDGVVVGTLSYGTALDITALPGPQEWGLDLDFDGHTDTRYALDLADESRQNLYLLNHSTLPAPATVLLWHRESTPNTPIEPLP